MFGDWGLGIGDWGLGPIPNPQITPENIDSKLGKFKIEEEKLKKEIENPIKVHISTADFTVQNVALKMGIPVQGIDGMKIRKIKNYILKCYSCNYFIFDTSKLFCQDCGYNTLMKIACSINSEGVLKIYDKDAQARSRGTQVT
jgi:RNA-binding protein NOB1